MALDKIIKNIQKLIKSSKLVNFGGYSMKKLLIGTALAAVLGITGCTSNAATPTTYDDYVASTQAAYEKAKAKNVVWKQKAMKKPYVDTWLDKAAEAKAKGDDAKAMEYVKEAYKVAQAQLDQIESWKTLKAGWEK